MARNFLAGLDQSQHLYLPRIPARYLDRSASPNQQRTFPNQIYLTNWLKKSASIPDARRPSILRGLAVGMPVSNGNVEENSMATHAHERMMARSNDAGTAMTIERAILLIVGLIVTASVAAAVYLNPMWLWVTGAMGAHLIQASFTGLCPVVAILKRLGLTSRPAFG